MKKLLGGLGAGLNPLNFIKSAIALVRLAAKEPLRGTLINVVTTHPSFAPARPLLKLLGIAETGEYTGDSLESWKEFVRLSEYMYEDIINNMTEVAIKDLLPQTASLPQAFRTGASRTRARARAPPRAHGLKKRRRYSSKSTPGRRIHLDIIGVGKPGPKLYGVVFVDCPRILIRIIFKDVTNRHLEG